MAKKKNSKAGKQQKRFSEREYLRTRMRSLPIGKCYLGPDAPEVGIVTVIVTREHPAGTLSVGMYLIDKFCCGVKDASYRFSVGKDELEEMLDLYREHMHMKEVPYTEAHNLVYGALAYAEEIGIPPHRDFEDAQYVLEEDNDDVPLIEYEFGRDGKPFLMCTSPVEQDYYRKLMLKKVGPDGFRECQSFDEGDDGDWDDDEDDDDEEETVTDLNVRVEGFESGIDLNRLCPLEADFTDEILRLDTPRMKAFFMQAHSVARQLGIGKETLDRLEKTVGWIDDVGDPGLPKRLEEAAGRLLELYCRVREAMFNEGKDSDFETYIRRLRYCMLYCYGTRWLRLTQLGRLNRMLRAGDPVQALEDWMDIRMRIDMLVGFYQEDVVKARKEQLLTLVSKWGLLSETWGAEKVKSQVKHVKLGFASKNPDAYYKRKVKETIDTPFKDGEDFMGLVFLFGNMVNGSLKLLLEGEAENAFRMLNHVLFDTLDAVIEGRFDQWIGQEGKVRDCFIQMLENTAELLLYTVYGGYLPLEECGKLMMRSVMTKTRMSRAGIDLVDLSPLCSFTKEFLDIVLEHGDPD